MKRATSLPHVVARGRFSYTIGAGFAVCIIIALLTTWAPTAEGARALKSQPFEATVKESPYKASRGVSGSQYVFSSVTPVYEVVNADDEMKISVGLIGLPHAKRPNWFASIDSESGVGDLVCHKGEKIWPPGMKEFDEETYLGGCMGTGLAVRFNKPQQVKVVPFSAEYDSVSDDGWRIFINGRHVASLTNPYVDHTQDRLLRISRARNAYGCIPLLEHYPSNLNCP
jgi:hypothetical protein